MKITSHLLALLLCGSALAGCATTPRAAKATGGQSAAEHDKGLANGSLAGVNDLDGNLRQAQLMRIAGNYAEAVHILSQIMLVASDNPRVVAEYGKTLAEQGRAQDAVQFLNRAVELQPGDWTVYSALGVAYDQLGNQTSARMAYDRALSIKPNEPSVLNNYALSRMLANDPAGARDLIARAQGAGGAADPKIARNIAMVNALANSQAPAPQAVAAAAPQKQTAMATVAMPAAPVNAAASVPVNNMSNAMPRQIAPQAAPQIAPQALSNNIAPRAPMAARTAVVMQAIPVDPLAGPVKLHPPKVAAKAPDSKAEETRTPEKVAAAGKSAKPADDAKPQAKVADAKPAAKPQAQAQPQAAGAKVADARPVVLKNSVPALRMAADIGRP